jgi:hypothetical protein
VSATAELITQERPGGFEGTATELLSALNSIVPEGTRKSKFWPQNAAQLGNRVSRAGKPLRAKGYIIDRGKYSGRRIIAIIPPGGDAQRMPVMDDYVPF